MPIRRLFINGLKLATSVGLSHIIHCCQKSVKVLECGYMDQETLNGQFCQAISMCFNLEELDLTGCSNVGDDGINLLPKGEVKNEELRVMEVIGLHKLKILKLGGLVKVTDHPLLKLTQTSHVLEHLELTNCALLTEYSIENLIKQTPTLHLLDLNGIPVITQPKLEELRLIKGDLLIKRYLYQNVDPKDNGLRVPRRVADKKKKKKGKKGGKKGKK